jgi:hypothetical protein
MNTASTPPLSSPPFLSAATAALRPPTATMRHPTLLVAASHSVFLLFVVLTRLFSCPFPRDPAPFLQTKIIVVLAIHLPTDSYPRQTSMPPSH